MWYGAVQYICTTATTEPAEGQANPIPEEDSAHWAVLPVEEMAKKSDVDTLMPFLFAQYYPEGNVKSAAEFTPGIKYGSFDDVNRTVFVLPFCNTGMAANDNSNLEGRVVIPPFVDAQGNGYISDDGTRFKVIGVANGILRNPQTALTAIVVPNTVTSVGDFAFFGCASLVSVSLFSVKTIKTLVFSGCRSLTSLFLPAATSIENGAFGGCTSLASTDFGSDLSSVPTLGSDVFFSVPTTCKIIVPDAQYDAWKAASGWSDLVTAGYKFLRHSEWEYARKYEVPKLSVDNTPADVNIVHISQDDYE